MVVTSLKVDKCIALFVSNKMKKHLGMTIFKFIFLSFTHFIF